MYEVDGVGYKWDLHTLGSNCHATAVRNYITTALKDRRYVKQGTDCARLKPRELSGGNGIFDEYKLELIPRIEAQVIALQNRGAYVEIWIPNYQRNTPLHHVHRVSVVVLASTVWTQRLGIEQPLPRERRTVRYTLPATTGRPSFPNIHHAGTIESEVYIVPWSTHRNLRWSYSSIPTVTGRIPGSWSIPDLVCNGWLPDVINYSAGGNPYRLIAKRCGW